MDQKEEELVAKDDNKGATEADPDEERERQKDGEEENQPNELMSEDVRRKGQNANYSFDMVAQTFLFFKGLKYQPLTFFFYHSQSKQLMMTFF